MTEKRSGTRASWQDYKELTKPNVVALMILTSIIGMFMAVPGMVPLDVLILGNLGIAMVAGAAAGSVGSGPAPQADQAKHRRAEQPGGSRCEVFQPERVKVVAAMTGFLARGTSGVVTDSVGAESHDHADGGHGCVK